MPSPELKPCPFCGNNAILETRGYDHKRNYRVSCNSVYHCGASQHWFDTMREAVAAWNRRAKEAAPK